MTTTTGLYNRLPSDPKSEEGTGDDGRGLRDRFSYSCPDGKDGGENGYRCSKSPDPQLYRVGYGSRRMGDPRSPTQRDGR